MRVVRKAAPKKSALKKGFTKAKTAVLRVEKNAATKAKKAVRAVKKVERKVEKKVKAIVNKAMHGQASMKVQEVLHNIADAIGGDKAPEMATSTSTSGGGISGGGAPTSNDNGGGDNNNG
ncbi:MAG TPA: hypothetical protein VHL57_04860 [Flavobacteriales bacterium]|nr:hypothetical protein [Flavobacteriales bacterium]